MKKIKQNFSDPSQSDQVPAARRLTALDPADLIEAVATYHGVPAAS